jgi:cation diffusion facilitator CzcD-associated flavoprotein CzcO
MLQSLRKNSSASSAARKHLRRCLSSHNVPSQARVVIVGGGIIGTSIAYHLGKMGMKDVVLLEQNKITSGTTWYVSRPRILFCSLNLFNE